MSKSKRKRSRALLPQASTPQMPTGIIPGRVITILDTAVGYDIDLPPGTAVVIQNLSTMTFRFDGYLADPKGE